MDLGTPVDHCRPADLGTSMHLDKLVYTCGLGKHVDVPVGTPVDRGTPMDLVCTPGLTCALPAASASTPAVHLVVVTSSQTTHPSPTHSRQ